ncbi:MAG: hypothetical protein ACI85O_002528 [Saprospiraceae bacterium]|jgi:hypothetical protein
MYKKTLQKYKEGKMGEQDEPKTHLFFWVNIKILTNLKALIINTLS